MTTALACWLSHAVVTKGPGNSAAHTHELTTVEIASPIAIRIKTLRVFIGSPG
jgi:hypothetical protein